MNAVAVLACKAHMYTAAEAACQLQAASWPWLMVSDDSPECSESSRRARMHWELLCKCCQLCCKYATADGKNLLCRAGIK